MDEGLTPCARGHWCLERDVTPGEGATGKLTPRTFCVSCRADIAARLAAFPGLAAGLADAITDPPQPEGTPVRVPHGPRLIISADADAALRHLVTVTVSWHDRVASRARLTVIGAGTARAAALTHGPALVTHAVRVIGDSTHLDCMISLPAAEMLRPSPLISVAPDGRLPERRPAPGGAERVMLDGAWAGNEIVGVHYLARSVVGDVTWRPERLKGVPCRGCEVMALRRAPAPATDDGDVFFSRCDRCGDLMTEPEYRDHVRAWAAYCDAGIRAT